MNSTRIYLPLAAVLVFLGLALAAVLLPFIPTYLLFEKLTFWFAMGGMVVSGIMLLRGTWLQTAAHMRANFRAVLVVALALLGLGLTYVVGIIGLFSLEGGLFSPVYHHAVEFPEYNTTIYAYNSSFLDPESYFTYRSGILPFESKIGTFGNAYPEDVEIVQVGEWAECDYFRIHLPTGEVTRLSP